MGKHKYQKGLGFLHNSHFCILREIETHTILKTWENCIVTVREMCGKTLTIFFLHISCEALIHAILKIWEK